MESLRPSDKLLFTMSDFKMIEHEEEFIFTSENRYQWFKTSRTGFDILRLLDSNHTLEEVVDNIAKSYGIEATIVHEDIMRFCRNLMTEKLISSENHMLSSKNSKQLKTAYIDITDACNQSCTYCSKVTKNPNDKPRYMGLNEFKGIIDRLKRESDDFTILYLTGGEPTLHPELVEMMAYASDQSLHVFLWTNGIGVSQEQLAAIKPVCNTIIVTLEGSQVEINDGVSDVGSFDRKMNTIGYLRDLEIPFLIASTPHKNNFEDIPNIYALAYNLGARGFFTNEPMFQRQDGEDLSSYFLMDMDKYKSVDEEINKQAILVSSWKNNQLKHGKGANLGTTYFKDTQKCFNNPIRLEKKSNCGACINEISIDPSGEVFPCHNLQLEPYKMGKVDAYFSLDQRAREGKFEKHEDCVDCFYWIFCLGGCKAKTMNWTKSTGDKNPDCEKMKSEYFKFLTSPLQPKQGS